MMVEDIITYLATNGLGTPAVNLFARSLPDLPDVCTAVYEYGGNPPSFRFGLPGLYTEEPGCKVVCRGVAWDRLGPMTRIYAVYRQLPRVQAITLSGTKYRMITPVQAPFPQEVDTKNRVLCTVNFIAEKEV